MKKNVSSICKIVVNLLIIIGFAVLLIRAFGK